MAPAVPTISGRMRSKLPVSRAALSAIDDCRRSHPFRTVAELSTVVTDAALSEGTTLTTAPAKYVIRRLVNGVSVSSGAARLNYSLILIALTRQLVAKGGKSAPADCVNAVKEVYGPQGSFDASHTGAPRERALGTLASIAAVVGGCEGTKFSANTLRDIVAMLYSTVDADAEKWRLGCAVVRVIERVLQLVKAQDNDALLKPLWAWCEARLRREDGLQLALLLQEKGMISNEAFVKLYPSLKDDVLPALLDTFEGGFTIVAEDLFQTEGSEKEELKNIVPSGWRMSVDYALTENGARHWGGISSFWQKAVRESLLGSSRSPEKKLLALQLQNLVLDRIHDEESFRIVFHEALSSTIGLFLSHHAHQKRRNGSAQLKTNRSHGYVMGQLSQSAKLLGESILTHLCGKSEVKTERARLMSGVLVWALRGGILFRLFPDQLLANSLKSMSRKDVGNLLAGIISVFAKPLNGADPSSNERKRNLYIRRDAVRLLFAVSRKHPHLLKDVVRVVVLYLFFQRGESNSAKEVKIPVTFEYFDVNKCGVEGDLYLGSLPKAEPDLNPKNLEAVFGQLLKFLIELRNGEHFQDTLRFCVDLIREVSNVDRSLCLPRGSTQIVAIPTGAKESKELQSIASDVIDQLSVSQFDGDGAAMSGALKTIAMFLYIHMLKPEDPTAEKGKGTQKLTSDYVSLMKKVISTSHLLLQESSKQKAGNKASKGEKIQEHIEPAEHIAHLITEICGQNPSSSEQIALLAVRELGPSIDDKVIAVFFDAMDSYLQEEENVEEEDDGEDEMETVETNGDKKVNFSAENDGGLDEDEISDEDDEGGQEDDKNSAEKSSKIGAGGQEMKKPAKEDGNGEGRGSDKDSDDDVGMDIDDEDPSVLENLDKVLGTHLGLLREERKLTKARKEKAAFRFVQASRVLSIIEAASRMLRVALEKWHEDDPKLPLIFMDLHVRLYEFALGEESRSSHFLEKVSNIVSKQMLLHQSAFDGKISDAQTALEITDRFFEVLKTAKVGRKGDVEVMRIVSRSAQSFLSIVEKVSGNAYSRYFPIYNDILDSMLQNEFHFWTPDVFHSFIERAPEISIKFLQPIDSALKTEHVTMTKRSLISDLIFMISVNISSSSNICPEVANNFWELIASLVQRECSGTKLTKKWTSQAFANMIRAFANGLAGGHIKEGHDIATALAGELDKFSFKKAEQSRLSKLLETNPETENEVTGKKRHREQPKERTKAGKKLRN